MVEGPSEEATGPGNRCVAFLTAKEASSVWEVMEKGHRLEDKGLRVGAGAWLCCGRCVLWTIGPLMFLDLQRHEPSEGPLEA